MAPHVPTGRLKVGKGSEADYFQPLFYFVCPGVKRETAPVNNQLQPSSAGTTFYEKTAQSQSLTDARTRYFR